MPVSEPLARVLAAARPRFNASVANARHRYPSFDTAAFRVFLETRVDALANAVEASAPDRVSVVVDAAYEVALDLVGQALAGPGAREPWVDRAWSDVAPRLAREVAQEPLKVLALLTNAVVRIGKTPGARTGEWIARLAELGPHAASVDELRALGQLLAWRCGLPHYRLGALEAGDRLPEDLAREAVCAAKGYSWSASRDRLRADPWWSPEPGVVTTVDLHVGAFTGFGGIFRAPPQVRAAPDGFVCRSEDRYAYLVADIFGAALLPATAEEFDTAGEGGGGPRLTGSTLAMPYGNLDLKLPAEGLLVASNTHSVAVTSPYSFHIRVLPRK